MIRKRVNKILSDIDDFIDKESSSGVLLIFATIFALVLSNSFLSPFYESFLHIPVEIHIGALHLAKSLHHWVNDGLMAIFLPVNRIRSQARID